MPKWIGDSGGAFIRCRHTTLEVTNGGVGNLGGCSATLEEAHLMEVATLEVWQRRMEELFDGSVTQGLNGKWIKWKKYCVGGGLWCALCGSVGTQDGGASGLVVS